MNTHRVVLAKANAEDNDPCCTVNERIATLEEGTTGQAVLADWASGILKEHGSTEVLHFFVPF